MKNVISIHCNDIFYIIKDDNFLKQDTSRYYMNLSFKLNIIVQS